MPDIVNAYAVLQMACSVLDAAGDHAIAAHVGMGMAMMEEKYGLVPKIVVDTLAADEDRPAVPRANLRSGFWN